MPGLWGGASGLGSGSPGLGSGVSGLWSGASGLQGGGGTPTPTPTGGYDVVLIAGQSNGRGAVPIGSTPDVPNTYQFGGNSLDAATYRKIVSGFPALQHYQTGAAQANFGPGNPFAAGYVTNFLQPGRRLLLVPTCLATTGLVGGRWAPPSGDLYLNAINQANLAIAAAELEFPGGTRFIGTLWHQGENDASSTITKAAYKTDQKALIAGFRAGITGAADSWFSIGGMPPPIIYNVTWTGQAINLAHIECAVEGTKVYFTPGRQGESQGDNLHYTQLGYEHLAGDIIAMLQSTTGPAISSQPAFFPTTGRKFGHQITVANQYTLINGGQFATFILGGADAAQFELVAAYLAASTTNLVASTVVAYRLRWIGDGTNANTGTTYNITLQARDGKGNLGPVQSCTVTVSAVGTVNPVTSLFQVGEYGLVFDPTDTATMRQSILGTGAVGIEGDAVGWLQSKHPNGTIMKAVADNTSRPTFRIDADAMKLLRSEGNDLLFADVVGVKNTMMWTSVTGLLGAGAISNRLLGEFSAVSAIPVINVIRAWTTAGEMSCNVVSDASVSAGGAVVAGALDSTKQVITTIMMPVPTAGTQRISKARKATARGAGGDGTGYTTLNVSGTLAGPVSTTRTALFAAYPSSGAANFITIDFYRHITVNTVREDYEIANMEDWVNAGTRITPLGTGFSTTFNAAPTLVYSEEERLVLRTDDVQRRAVRSITGHTSGKWYVELLPLISRLRFAGVVDSSFALNGGGGPAGTNRCGLEGANLVAYPSVSDPIGEFAVPNVPVRVAYDADNDLFWLALGTGPWNGSLSADPETGVGGLSTAGLAGAGYVGVTLRPVVGAGVRYRLPGDLGYSLPAGYSEWSS